jgi:hypothetical protein
MFNVVTGVAAVVCVEIHVYQQPGIIIQTNGGARV